MTMHIGKHIEQVVREQGVSIVSLAKQLYCTRGNIYKIFEKENVDIALLVRISSVLKHDFFLDISRENSFEIKDEDKEEEFRQM